MSADTTTNIRTRLRDHYLLVTGIVKGFNYMPRTMQAVWLPAVVVLPGAGTYEQDPEWSEEHYLESRTYFVRLLISEAGLSQETETENDGADFIDAIRDHFRQRPGLSLPTDVQPQAHVYSHALEGDSGLLDGVPYPKEGGKLYVAVEFRHAIEVVRFANIKD